MEIIKGTKNGPILFLVCCFLLYLNGRVSRGRTLIILIAHQPVVQIMYGGKRERTTLLSISESEIIWHGVIEENDHDDDHSQI